MITDIYRIKTLNSFYEIRVLSSGNSMCRKLRIHTTDSGLHIDGPWMAVQTMTLDYLAKLYIGASFKIPGVTDTSDVVDYQHLVPSTEPKRRTSPGVQDMIDEIVAPLRPRHRVVNISDATRGEVKVRKRKS